MASTLQEPSRRDVVVRVYSHCVQMGVARVLERELTAPCDVQRGDQSPLLPTRDPVTTGSLAAVTGSHARVTGNARRAWRRVTGASVTGSPSSRRLRFCGLDGHPGHVEGQQCLWPLQGLDCGQLGAGSWRPSCRKRSTMRQQTDRLQ